VARAKNVPNDPDRRERIIEATMDLLQDDGVGAVSARAVAGRAGVPLSSVSYHFRSVRELLLEASRRVAASRTAGLATWSADLTPETVIPRLAEQIHEQITTGRSLTVIAYELYILGLRDPEFRSVSASVSAALREAIGLHLPDADAVRLAATAEGLQLSSLVQDEPPDIPSLREALRNHRRP
jgi:DNA-binding transcriptional regulator YbjK